jgi:hypothetical protein
VGYGYADELVVLTPASVVGKADDLVIDAEASWLSCDVVCVKRSARRRLRINIPSGPQPRMLAAWRSLLPTPVNDEVSELSWLGPDSFRVTTRAGLEPVEFFPRARLAPDDRDCLHTRPDTRTLDVQLRTVNGPRPVEGVLMLQDAGGVRYVELSLP